MKQATEKQIKFAKDIATVLNIKLPKENSVQSYSDFISNYIEQFYSLITEDYNETYWGVLYNSEDEYFANFLLLDLYSVFQFTNSDELIFNKNLKKIMKYIHMIIKNYFNCIFLIQILLILKSMNSMKMS